MREFNVTVRGTAQGAFEPMRQIFARSLGAQLEGGAQFSVYHHGRKVVDLTGGDFADDSVMLVFSISKAVSAVATHHAVAAGKLRLDMPIHEVWPEFARSSLSRSITVDHILTHSAGLPSVERVLTMDDHIAGELERELETQEPYWEPGTEHGYHALTWGALLDGVFRRAQSVSVSDYIRIHIATPLGLDLSLGATEEQLGRVRPYVHHIKAITPLEKDWNAVEGGLPDGAGQLLWPEMTQYNRPDVLRQVWPSTNLVSSARDLARAFAAVIDEVDGVRLLSDESLKGMTNLRYRGEDRMLRFPISFGTGVQLPFPQFPMLGPGSFGHEGAGGAVAVVDPRRGLSIAFITDQYPTSNGAAQTSYSLLSAAALIVDELEEKQ
jgi:CubicO group peptidase (beta-lactamase class C family)